MRTFIASTLLLATAVRSVAGHYQMTQLIIDGKKSGEWEYVRKVAPYLFPAFNISDPEIRCGPYHDSSDGITVRPLVKTARIHAGDTVRWNAPWGWNPHPGFLTAWLSRTPDGVDIETYEGDGEWFKIGEVKGRTEQSKPMEELQGYERGASMHILDWGILGKADYSFAIPKTTPAGNYLFRWEHVYARPGVVPFELERSSQIYTFCAQLDIVNDGVQGTPGPTVKIPGHYSWDDPNVFKYDADMVPIDSITVPGPEVWVG